MDNNKIYLDLDVRRNTIKTIALKQYNILSQELIISVTEDGKPYTLPSNGRYILRMLKPDGTYIYNSSDGLDNNGNTISNDTMNVTTITYNTDNTISILLGQNACATAGIANVELQIAVGTFNDTHQFIGKVINTMSFKIKIVESTIPDSAVESNNEGTYLNRLAKELVQDRNDAEAYANQTKSYTVGTDGEIREGDATDNAKYYYEQTKAYTVGTDTDKTHNSEYYYNQTRSLTEGTDGEIREGDATDNAKYYYEQAKHYTIGGLEGDTDNILYYYKQTKSYAVGTDGEVREGDATDNILYYYKQTKSYTVGTDGEVREGDATDNGAYYYQKTTENAEAAATSETNAKSYEDSAKNYRDYAQSYAIGEGGARGATEATDNAKYYYEQARTIAESLNGVLLPMGTISFEDFKTLDETGKIAGYTYNINEDFISDETFKDGGGIKYNMGTNVYLTSDGYWDCLVGDIPSIDDVVFVGTQAELESAIENNTILDGTLCYVTDDGENNGGIFTVNVLARISTRENNGLKRDDDGGLYVDISDYETKDIDFSDLTGGTSEDGE